ncbi:hypothetical protein BACPEC_00576 [[Bacteroides] pectinophilus ATCC 43243]|uniref:Uncharacterized protein n=1 Tax=[Bacteroides] pectinophilus ATCC 43243 TaxID=483218 RepID=B7APH0_9FIRM|nr:hypothetical protein BACPEC_00576 [[Bacteroides] pectinophilus ATCC 43243]
MLCKCLQPIISFPLKPHVRYNSRSCRSLAAYLFGAPLRSHLRHHPNHPLAADAEFSVDSSL